MLTSAAASRSGDKQVMEAQTRALSWFPFQGERPFGGGLSSGYTWGIRRSHGPNYRQVPKRELRLAVGTRTLEDSAGGGGAGLQGSAGASPHYRNSTLRGSTKHARDLNLRMSALESMALTGAR